MYKKAMLFCGLFFLAIVSLVFYFPETSANRSTASGFASLSLVILLSIALTAPGDK